MKDLFEILTYVILAILGITKFFSKHSNVIYRRSNKCDTLQLFHSFPVCCGDLLK